MFMLMFVLMWRMPRGAPAALGCMLALLLMTGCATERAWSSPPGQPPSRVFESEPQRERAAERTVPAEPIATPWYAQRHDAQPAVVVGPRKPVVEHSATLTIDRQRTIRGQVRDHHRTTTYRREVRYGVR